MQLSERAASEIKRLIEEESLGDVLLRVAITGAGCHGFTYHIGFENIQEEGDTIVEIQGVRLVLDKVSSPFMEETTLDFTEDENRRGFIFNGPDSSCSSGSCKGCQ